MDFTSVYLTPKIGGSQENTTVQDFIIVFEFIDERDQSKKKRVVEYMDFLCDCSETNKNDYFFVLHVWLQLFRFKELDKHFDLITIWSDGGPHHFKTKFCQWMWHWLSDMKFNKKPIIHNFFAAYHGHSLADSHAASVKRVLKTQYDVSSLVRMCPNVKAIYWGPANAQEYSTLLSQCSNTQVHVIPHVDRDPALKPTLAPLDSIKSKHCFVYFAGLCASAEQSDAGVAFPFVFELGEPESGQPDTSMTDN